MGDRDDHLSRISTIWTDVLNAHGDDQAAVRAAQSAIMERYSSAIHRYLCKVLGDPDAADEVFQQFALQFVRRAFRNANPDRGRFRDYVKISILNLVSRYRRGLREKTPHFDLEQLADRPDDEKHADREALHESLRDEFLRRAWKSLLELETSSGTPYHQVLTLRAGDPQLSSEDLADRLNTTLNTTLDTTLNTAGHRVRPITAAGARKILQRARQHLAEFLLQEVSRTLENGGRDELVDEVRELGLYAYCRSALDRR